MATYISPKSAHIKDTSAFDLGKLAIEVPIFLIGG